MPTINFIKEKRKVDCAPGENLRTVAQREGIELYPGFHKNFWANCHGLGLCASCRVHVKKGLENVSPQSIREKVGMLANPEGFIARLGHEQECRLACQTRVNGDIDVETQPELNLYGERFWG